MHTIKPSIRFREFSLIECFIFGVAALILLKNVWLSEDAFITLRVVDNFSNGYGLRWNISERVEVFTHPLWVFTEIPVHFLFRNPYLTALLPSIFLSMGLFYLVLTRFGNARGCFVAILLLLSKSFIDYSSSGLENPLSHFLLLQIYLDSYNLDKCSPDSKKSRLMLLIALLMLCRLDLLVLCLPLAYRLLKHGSKLKILRSLLPWILWEFFSLFYYGFLLPNTFYAKVVHTLPLVQRIELGLYYFLNIVSDDPLTFVVLFTSIILLFTRSLSDKTLPFGIFLYSCFILLVGGDYMGGRFFSPVYLLAVLLITERSTSLTTKAQFCLALVIISLGFSGPRPTLLTTAEYTPIIKPASFVFDEKGYRFKGTGLLSRGPKTKLEDAHAWIKEAIDARKLGDTPILHQSVGMFGYFVGPKVEVIDPYAITDAYLAHLPEIDPMVENIYGSHFRRKLPIGYLDYRRSLSEGTEQVESSYFSCIHVLTRGPLISLARLKMILSVIFFGLPSKS